MQFRRHLPCALLTAIAFTSMSEIASSQQVVQHDALCFIRTESGQEIVLNRFCGISEPNKKEQKPVFKQKKYPIKVEGTSSLVTLGGKEPQTLPNGDVVYPDGTIQLADGTTLKVEFRNGLPEGFKHYDKNGKLID